MPFLNRTSCDPISEFVELYVACFTSFLIEFVVHLPDGSPCGVCRSSWQFCGTRLGGLAALSATQSSRRPSDHHMIQAFLKKNDSGVGPLNV